MTRWSRRELLLALSALPAAACSGRPAGRRLAGGLVGADAARGHRLLERLAAGPARRESAAVVIAGGGIAGLAAGWTLARAGFEDFVVLELEGVPGGTARSGAGPVVPHPWGAHYVPVPDAGNRPLLALLEELGAVAGRDRAGQPLWAEEALCRDPQERLFHAGEWQEGLYPRAGASRADLAELERFEREMRGWAAWRDPLGRAAFTLPRALGSDAEELRALDRLSFGEWLERHGYRSPRLLWLLDYGCRDDFGAGLGDSSAWAGLHYHAARLDAASGEPAEVLTWPEGNGRLVRHLTAALGPRLRCAQLVAEVVERDGAVEVTALDAASGERVAWRCARAIAALPSFVADRVVGGRRQERRGAGEGAVYGAWVVANLWLRERPVSRGFPLSWDNVIFASPSLGYVVATHQIGRDHGPTVLTWYHPLVDRDAAAARRRLLASTWQDWAERAIADLAPAHPGFAALVERVDVCFWGHGMVRPRPGWMWSDALGELARPRGAVHFAHTDLSGMALVEEAVYHGVRAAEEVLCALRWPHASWLASG